jgi:pyruvate kinase
MWTISRISFPKNASDMQYARSLANEAAKSLHKEIRLIAKIERAEAIEPGVLRRVLSMHRTALW